MRSVYTDKLNDGVTKMKKAQAVYYNKEKKKSNSNKKEIWEVDTVYRKYVSDHFPEAIEFIRKNFNGYGNKWIDIKGYEEYPKFTPSGVFLPGSRDIILFEYIDFDIFERKIKPEYKKDDIDYNRYITWKTATEDIAKQRAAGINGKHKIIKCGLDIEKTPVKIKKVRVRERDELVDNPEYKLYLESEEYKKYLTLKETYDSNLTKYKNYRRNYHRFVLPDGTTKDILLYKKDKIEEKFKMLRDLGVSEDQIEKSRRELIEPIEPIKPDEPPKKIIATIPEHYEDRQIPSKWVWCHYIKPDKK